MEFKLEVTRLNDEYETNIVAGLVLGVSMNALLKLMGTKDILANTDPTDLKYLLDDYTSDYRPRGQVVPQVNPVQAYFDSLGLGAKPLEAVVPSVESIPASGNETQSDVAEINGVDIEEVRKAIQEEGDYETLFAPLHDKCVMGNDLTTFTDDDNQDFVIGVSVADLLSSTDSFVSELVLGTADKIRTLTQMMIPLDAIKLYQGSFYNVGG